MTHSEALCYRAITDLLRDLEKVQRESDPLSLTADYIAATAKNVLALREAAEGVLKCQ
jgi:hypothetical protein